MGSFTEISPGGANRRKPGRTLDIAFLQVKLQDFKDIASSYGEDVGLVALKTLAELLQSNIRQNDILVHKGEGEFIILLAGQDDGHADQIVLRRLHLLLDTDLILTIGRERIRIHGLVSIFNPDKKLSPFQNATEITVFVRATR